MYKERSLESKRNACLNIVDARCLKVNDAGAVSASQSCISHGGMTQGRKSKYVRLDLFVFVPCILIFTQFIHQQMHIY